MRSELNERQNQIMARIQREGEVRINDLKEPFQVTEMTIRRDLEKLEHLGLVRRTLGGCIPVTIDISLKERKTVMIDEKMKIGRIAAELVLPGQSIFIDGGTTTLEIARHLKPHSEITVVTNAINVAEELMEKQIYTLVIGGMLLEKTLSLVGPIAVETLQKMAFDQIFLGTTGFSLQHGFSNSNVFEAELKKKAIQKAAKVNIVIDHSKFGASLLVSFAELSDVHRIVTDKPIGDELAEACKQQGVDVIL